MRLSSVFGGEGGVSSALTDTVQPNRAVTYGETTDQRPAMWGVSGMPDSIRCSSGYSDPGPFRCRRRVHTRDGPRLDDSQPARVCPRSGQSAAWCRRSASTFRTRISPPGGLLARVRDESGRASQHHLWMDSRKHSRPLPTAIGYASGRQCGCALVRSRSSTSRSV